MIRRPSVSIGMPVYNGERFICEALNSLLSQGFEDFELVISDNASQDGSEAICREYAARDRRIRYHRSPRNRGAAWNFNRTFELSRGEFFMWAADDDVREPSYLTECLHLLREDPDAVLCHCFTSIMSEAAQDLRVEKTPIPENCRTVRSRQREVLDKAGYTLAFYGLMRSAAMRQTRLYQTHYGSDGGFVAELALYGNFLCVPEALFRYRQRSREILLMDYVARTYESLDPGNHHRWFTPHRLIAGWKGVEGVLRSPLPIQLKMPLILDLTLTCCSSHGMALEVLRMVTEALGPRRTSALATAARPLWRRLRSRGRMVDACTEADQSTRFDRSGDPERTNPGVDVCSSPNPAIPPGIFRGG